MVAFSPEIQRHFPFLPCLPTNFYQPIEGNTNGVTQREDHLLPSTETCTYTPEELGLLSMATSLKLTPLAQLCVTCL